jgi:hypothetical protein
MDELWQVLKYTLHNPKHLLRIPVFPACVVVILKSLIILTVKYVQESHKHFVSQA